MNGQRLQMRARCAALLAAVCVCLLAARPCWALPGASLPALHPQDGPHVDLRAEILPDRVVQHVAMNLVFLDEFAPMPRELPDDVDPAELPLLSEALADAMRTKAPMTIDGVAVTPQIVGLRLAAVDASLLPLFPRSGMRGMRRVEFDAVYPVKQPPRTATIGWRAFPADILSTPEQPRTIVIACELEGEGKRQGIELSVDAPEFVWKAPTGRPEDELLAVPAPPVAAAAPSAITPLALIVFCALFAVIAMRTTWRQRKLAASMCGAAALACAGYAAWGQFSHRTQGLPTHAQAAAAFSPIHANLYRALDYVREHDVYDVLARSADGQLLENLYRQMQRGLAIEEAGGAVGRVAAVRPIETTVDRVALAPVPGAANGAQRAEFTVTTRWQVDGTVSHWGHRHDRTNEYRARYTVAATPAGWRIVAEELLSEDRVDTPPEVQPLDVDGVM